MSQEEINEFSAQFDSINLAKVSLSFIQRNSLVFRVRLKQLAKEQHVVFI
jgi:hypothetical protein